MEVFSRNTQGHMKFKDFERVQKQLAFEYPDLDVVAESMLITDNRQEDCPIVFCNDLFERMTMYPKECVLGVNCRFLQGPLTDKVVVQRIRAAVDEGRALTVEILNYRRDGVPFWNIFTLLPVHKKGKKSGKAEFFLAIQKDVSVLKALGKDVSEWSVPEVGMWLETKGLGHCVARFQRAGIDGQRLAVLEADDLRHAEIRLASDRKRVLEAVRDDFDEELHYKHGLSPDRRGKLRELEANAQIAKELNESNVCHEFWGELDLGVYSGRQTVKCYHAQRTPVVLMLEQVDAVGAFKKQLRSHLGRKYVPHVMCGRDKVPLRSDDQLREAYKAAQDCTLCVYLGPPKSSGLNKDVGGILSCIQHPVLVVDAFGLVSHANDAAQEFCIARDMVDTPVERWVPIENPRSTAAIIHQLAGQQLQLNVSRTDDTEELCDIHVHLYTPGVAVVSFSPASRGDVIAI
eukprot:TRINITY_DN2643_c0_g1_i1.p1 TRINITY_DN2643_c0_g1~~TRINITY_DN2643_c0_g1_i1.p1  ORF type:complete len:483 (-),score=180.45 TRINITY_DN2643_c0_g1_i1:258-1637(-)